MAKLYFRIGADFDRVIRLRDEINKLKKELLSMNMVANPSNFSALERQLRRTSQEFENLVQQAATAGAQLQNTNININHLNNGFGNLNSVLAKVGGTAALTKLASDIVHVRGMFQQLEIAFETMLKSKEKASALMAQLTETAAKTPFDLQSVSQGAKQLLAYGTASEEVNDTLIRLGNIASGLSIPLGDLVYLYGTTQTQGRLFTQDVRQFMGRGIPLVKELASELGKTEKEINEMVTAGKIGFPEVEKVIRNMTNEGGQFYNLMERQSASLTGQISNLGDAWDSMLNEIGTQTQGAASAGISAISSLVENYEKVGKILTGLILTYGTYRAATIAYYAITKTYGVYDIATKELQFVATMKNIVATKALAVQQALLNKTMLSNPYVLAATLLVGAATAMWALYDSTTAAERAQKKYNKTKADSLQKEEEHKSRLEDLIATIQNEYTSSMNRVKAIEAIKKEYPSLFQKYIDEKGHIKDLIGLWKEYNEEVTKNKVETNKKNLSDSTVKIEEYEKMLSLWKKLGENPYYRKKRLSKEEFELAEKYKGETESSLRRKLELAKPSRDLYQKEVRSDELAQWQLDLKKSTDIQIKTELEEMKRLQQARKNNKRYSLNVGVGSLKGSTTESELANRIAILQSEYDSRSKTETKNKEHWTNQKKEAEKALESIDSKQRKLLNAGRFDKVDSKVVANYKEQKRLIAEAEKELKVYDSSSKQESATEKRKKEAEKQKKEQQKSTEELLALRRQNQQDEINLMKDGTEKKLKQIDLDYQKELDSIRKQEKDLSERQGGKLTQEQSIEISTRYTNAENKKEKDIADVTKELNSILDKYRDYSTQRIAIEKQFQDDEKKLREGLSKAQNDSEKKKYEDALKELSIQRKKAKEAISKSEIEDSGIWETLMGDVDALPIDTLEKLLSDAEQLVKATNLSATDMKAMMDTINNARQNLIARNPFKTLKEEYEKYQKAIKKGDKQGASTSWSNVEQASESIKNNISMLGTALSSLGNTFSSELGDGIQKAVDVISDGITAFEVFGKTGEKSAGDTVKGISGIIGIITTLIGTVMDAFDTTAEEQARNIEYQRRQEGYWDSINYQVERYLELLKEATANDYFELAGKSLTTLEESRRKAYQDIVKSMPGGDVDSTTFGLAQLLYYGKFSSKLTEQNFGGKTAKEIFDFINANGGYDLENKLISEEAIWAMKNNADIWSKLPEWMQNAIDKFVELNNQAKKLDGTLNEDLFQTTSKSIEEAILEGLKGGKRGIADFGENFEEIMRNALLQSFVIEQLRGKAQEFYKKYTLLADSDKDGKLDLTAEEIKDLRTDWNDIIKAATEEAKNIDSIIGSSSSSQESTKKGFAAASQDSIDELNGRFTALQIAGEEIKNQSITQTGLLSSINEKISFLDLTNENIPQLMDSTPNIAGQTREIISNSYQPQVSVVFPDAKLDILTTEVSTLKNIVNEMRSLQVEGNLDTQEIREGIQIISKNSPQVLASMDEMKRGIKKVL